MDARKFENPLSRALPNPLAACSPEPPGASPSRVTSARMLAASGRVKECACGTAEYTIGLRDVTSVVGQVGAVLKINNKEARAEEEGEAAGRRDRQTEDSF